LITPSLNYLNQSEYFSAMQKVGLANLKQDIAQNNDYSTNKCEFSANVKAH
jgi:hypothetical protein